MKGWKKAEGRGKFGQGMGKGEKERMRTLAHNLTGFLIEPILETIALTS